MVCVFMHAVPGSIPPSRMRRTTPAYCLALTQLDASILIKSHAPNAPAVLPEIDETLASILEKCELSVSEN